MIIAWLLFPIVLLVVCVGLGLAVERLAGVRLPGAILPSAGLALLIVVASLTTYENATAKLTTPIVVVLALCGYATSWRRVRELRLERFGLAVGLSVYAVLAAPVVLSGNASFLGYFQLNDAAIHFALIDQLLAHGRDLSGVHGSSVSNLLHRYISTDYPVGSQVALGAVRPLIGQDVAWIFQPYLAVILSLGGLAVYQLLGTVVRSRSLRALCAFVAAQTGLVYAYYLQASIKEVATTWVITLIVVLVFEALREELSVRRLVPITIATVAAFDVLNVAMVPWVGVAVAVFAVSALWRARPAIVRATPRRRALLGGAGVVVMGIIAAPVLATGKTSFDALSSQLTKRGDLGNLSHPLSKWELLGIWPSGDFRISYTATDSSYYVPGTELLTKALIGLAVLSALVGTAWALWRRAGGPLLLLGGSGLAATYLLSRASPYAGAKVLMVASTPIMVMVMLGAAALHDLGSRRRRVGVLPGWTLGLLVAAGVLWTNVDAYGGAKPAPRAELAELASIGDRFAGDGPAFFNLGDEYAVHFLRREQTRDPAIEVPRPRFGAPPRMTLARLHQPWDLDELDESYVQSFKLLVLGRSPLASHPPANYRLAYRGRFYEVWRRASTPDVLAHLPLGQAGVPLGAGAYPASIAPCREVLAFASMASQERARLAYVSTTERIVLRPTQMRYLQHAEGNPMVEGLSSQPGVLLRQSGVVVGRVLVRTVGRYEVWLGGSFGRGVEVRIDGRRVGSVSYKPGPLGQLFELGFVQLVPGVHAVSIVVPDKPLVPGANLRELLRPLVLSPAGEADGVKEASPAAGPSLCGRELDWLEIVR